MNQFARLCFNRFLVPLSRHSPLFTPTFLSKNLFHSTSIKSLNSYKIQSLPEITNFRNTRFPEHIICCKTSFSSWTRLTSGIADLRPHLTDARGITDSGPLLNQSINTRIIKRPISSNTTDLIVWASLYVTVFLIFPELGIFFTFAITVYFAVFCLLTGIVMFIEQSKKSSNSSSSKKD